MARGKRTHSLTHSLAHSLTHSLTRACVSSGAELAGLANDAALLAVRARRRSVEQGRARVRSGLAQM